ncbi:bifunctional tetrahydrofolate synthase/dihydrofolate synthase [Ignatzschineria ureiclastica]|uniref:Dihydrofolate synthase/folylpolyglutamate synthase n=1 Tax=Ignatzschineria ureiclastica TaxID=472582 RepID=A0A2U2AGG6_9GAMM|nr:bifunctional tetrahydrofolate synthase/dihydrofolate synthase [Ignatzschineria ureiclastica]PWD81754.1 bifunctional tetrahydrofolate synthase/dihydrofolate synthase [Ignatzschineria ureiclastica]GGZ90291.1 bifunctional protein FolC [Ignatzschineria ureiclastica]
MAPTHSLQSWLTYLEAIHPLSMDFKLARIQTVYARLNLAPIAPLIITVAGTNGKGSTSTTIANLYRAAGYEVGLFTSPHIHRFNERIRLNLEEVADSQLIKAFEQIEAARGEITLTYFEFATLAAFIIFKEAKVDVAVLEVGLGGRLDSTNIVDADIAIITPIGLDHTAQLGNTLHEIAGEKAGIIKPHAFVVTAETTPDSAIIDKAQQERATLYINGKDYRYHVLDNGQFEYQWQENSAIQLLAPKLQGLHQYQNAAAAISALYLSQSIQKPTFKAKPFDQATIQAGLQSVKLEGRFQALTRQDFPRVFLDVTHNPQGATALRELLESIKQKSHQALPNQSIKIVALLGMLQDKDAAGLVTHLAQVIDEWVTVSLEGDRGQSAADLASRITPLIAKAPQQAPTIATGCSLALSDCQVYDIILVFGSFHMIAESLAWFKENNYV